MRKLTDYFANFCAACAHAPLTNNILLRGACVEVVVASSFDYLVFRFFLLASSFDYLTFSGPGLASCSDYLTAGASPDGEGE